MKKEEKYKSLGKRIIPESESIDEKNIKYIFSQKKILINCKKEPHYIEKINDDPFVEISEKFSKLRINNANIKDKITSKISINNESYTNNKLNLYLNKNKYYNGKIILRNSKNLDNNEINFFTHFSKKNINSQKNLLSLTEKSLKQKIEQSINNKLEKIKVMDNIKIEKNFNEQVNYSFDLIKDKGLETLPNFNSITDTLITPTSLLNFINNENIKTDLKKFSHLESEINEDFMKMMIKFVKTKLKLPEEISYNDYLNKDELKLAMVELGIKDLQQSILKD